MLALMPANAVLNVLIANATVISDSDYQRTLREPLVTVAKAFMNENIPAKSVNILVNSLMPQYLTRVLNSLL